MRRYPRVDTGVSMRLVSVSTVFALLAAGSLGAQTTYIAPVGVQKIEGNFGNMIPWGLRSATYQQVHDAMDLAAVFQGTPQALIRGLSFRKDWHSAGFTARSLDAQVTLGTTPITAATATTTFATNLGPSPQVVLPYTSLSFPTLVNSSPTMPNPQGWFYPFAAPFPYSAYLGNLCWELRFKNITSTILGYNDTHSASIYQMFGTPLGTACVATGKSLPATIGDRSLDVVTGA